MNSLEQLLKSASRSQFINKGLSLLCKLTKYIFMAFVLVLITDIIWHWEPQQRINGLIIYGSLLGLIFAYLFWYSFIRTKPLKNVAREIEENQADCGSKLINTLDLSDQLTSGKLTGNSATIAERAIEKYASELDLNQFKEALHPRTFLKEFKRTFLILGVLIALLIPVRHVVQLELLRFFDPYGDHPAFSLTQLNINSPADDNHKVVYGKSLVISALSSGHRPNELFVSFHPKNQPDKIQTLPMFNKGEMGFSQQLENVKDELTIFVHTADKRSVSKKRQAGLILTPKVEKAIVTIEPPAYTGKKTVSKPYSFRNITALNGSKISFSLESNRPLKEGAIAKIAQDKEETIKLLPHDKNKVTGGFTAAENCRMRFQITDVDGNKAHELLKGSLTVTYDQGPSVTILTPEQDSYVTEDFLLKVKFMANDDYGIKQMRLHRALNGFYGPPLTFNPEDSTHTSLTQMFEINIPTLGVVPGDIISIYADTIDNSPKGQAAISPVVHLQVVSVKEYNEYLRQQAEIADISNKYSEMQERLAELAEQQKKLNKEMERLKELAKEGKGGDKLKDQLNKLIQKQNEINSKIAKLADDFEDFGRDDPLYDVEDSFAKEMQQQADKLRESIEENEDELKEFSDQSEKKGQTPQQLAEALESLQEAGERQKQNLQQNEEEYTDRVLKTIRDMSLMNEIVKDFNHFKYLYQRQQQLAEKSKRFDVIRDLSRADELALKKHAAEEKQIGQELEMLIENLLMHAEDAELQFPKACQSARDLAEQIKEARLTSLAEKAVNSMLIPDGQESYQLAERLRTEMRKMFNDMQQGINEPNPYMQNEFDNYLRLMLGMEPGSTFQQMCQSRRFGLGRGKGRGMGSGMAGSGGNGGPQSGYNMGPQIGLLGNENLGNPGDKEGNGDGKHSKGRSDGDANEVVAITQDKKSKALNSRKMTGEAVSSDNLINEYESLIDAYFEKITEEE